MEVPSYSLCFDLKTASTYKFCAKTGNLSDIVAVLIYYVIASDVPLGLSLCSAKTTLNGRSSFTFVHSESTKTSSLDAKCPHLNFNTELCTERGLTKE